MNLRTGLISVTSDFRLEYVRRSLSIALVIWLGLLWVASPALACARVTDRDCCSPDTTSPCTGTGTDLSTVSALCCSAAPAASPSVAADAGRAAHVQPDTLDSPDAITAFAWLATLGSLTEPPPLAPPEITSVRFDAALTYLHTLRLRL
jgi:hypothetical protein